VDVHRGAACGFDLARKPDMIGVPVGEQDPIDGLDGGPGVEEPGPELVEHLAIRGVHAGVDQRRPVPILENVHVVEPLEVRVL